MNTDYMKKAIEYAKKGSGAVNPNPLVGAVVVKEDEIVGIGYHKYYGGPHAEVYAIDDAGEYAKDADIYVTLEPCSHYGKTPPCVDKIINAGIRRCYIAMKDPNPLVAGRGIEKLRSHGIEVITGVMEEEAKKLNPVFLKYITTGFPYVFLKCAVTIDGKIATKSGDSKWITGDKAREEVHRIRNRYMGIMVGVNTVLNDDPELNVRINIENKRNPYRLVIDPNLDTPKNAKFVKNAKDGKSIIITELKNMTLPKAEYLREHGIKFITIDGYPFRMKDVMAKIGRVGIDSVVIEGGKGVISSFFKEHLIDGGEIFIAPKILGDENGLSFIGGFSQKSMGSAFELKEIEVKSFDKDISIAFSGIEWKETGE